MRTICKLLLVVFLFCGSHSFVSAQSKTINVNLYSNNGPYNNAAWNNWEFRLNPASNLFKYTDGTVSTITSSVRAGMDYAQHNNYTTLPMCPNEVGQYALKTTWGQNEFYDTLKGLNNSKFYDLSFYSSHPSGFAEYTRYIIGTDSIDINNNNNTTTPATFLNRVPTNGMIVIHVVAVNFVAYLEGFTIVEKSAVSGPNALPVSNAGPDQVITLPANSVTLNGSGSTDDHAIVGYQWTKITGTGGSLTTPNAAITTFTGLTAGVYTIELKVTDDSSAVSRDTVQITVFSANQPPVVNAGTAQTITQPVSSATLSGSASDIDGSIASHVWTFITGPVTPLIVSPSSYSTNVTGMTASGIYTFRLSATDNNNATSSADVTITVNSANVQTRTINVNLYSNSGPYNNAAWNNWEFRLNPTSAPFKYTDGSTSTITSSVRSGMDYALHSNYITLPMCPNEVGQYALKTTWGQNTFNDTLKGLNNSKLYDLYFYSSHPSGFAEYTRYVIGNDSVDINNNNNTTTAATFLNVVPVNGMIVVKIVAVNFIGYVEGFTLVEKSVAAPNTAPVARAGADQSITLPNNSVTLNGTGSTDDHNIVSYQWTKLTGTGGTITAPTTSITTFTGLTAGLYTVELRVVDDSLAIGRDTIQIFVNNPPNQPPVAKAGIDQTIVLPVSAVTLNGTASTDDHTIVSYLWTKLTGTGGTLATPTSSTTAFSGLTAGLYTLELKVTDDSSAVSRDTVQITVLAQNPPNQAPVARAGADQSITLPANSVTLNGTSSTDDHTIISYLWTKLTGTGGVISTPNASTTTFTGLTAGVYTVELRVVDDSSAVGRDTIQITVNSLPNQPPVAKAGADQSITLPVNSVSLNGTASTDDHNIVSYQWTKISGIGGTFSAPTQATTTFSSLNAGIYQVELRVTDDSSAVSRDTVQIIVFDYPAPSVTTNSSQTINLPTDSISFSSTAVSNYSITSTKWTKLTVPGQTLKRIVVVGSSTSAGTGASVPDSSFVNRLKAYYKSLGVIDTIYNQSVGGTWIMDVNITAALNTGANVLLVNYPSNNYTSSNLAASIAKFQEIKDSCDARGVQFYCTGTQPRNDYNSAGRGNLIVLNDSLRNRFGSRFIDFLKPMLDLGDSTVKAEYRYGDGIHVNDAGHERFFQIVRAANVFQNIISSPSVIQTPGTASTKVKSLVAGTHRFQISVIDSRGFAANAVATVVVNSLANVAPTANAGNPQNIILPTSIVTLTGSGTDTDGTISAYAWTQLSGPNTSSIISPSSATTIVSGLVQGTYIFRLTVTDNQSATGFSDVTITVSPAPTQIKTINVNLYSNGSPANLTGWNDWEFRLNPSSAKLKYNDGTNSNISISTRSGLDYAQNSSYVTLPMCPNEVGMFSVKTTFGTINTFNDTIKGLDNNKLYDLSFYSSHPSGFSEYTRFMIGNDSIDINDNNNTVNAATFVNKAPSNGQIVVKIIAVNFVGYVNGLSIYEKTVLNTPPVAKAGGNKSITLPTNSVTLDGSGSTDDHNIVAYSWTKISGPSGGTFSAPNAAITSFSGLIQGTYKVELKVTDDSTAIGRDTATIVVNPNQPNQRPVARAGADQVVVLPTNAVTLNGTASTDDHTIVSYQWTKLTGTGGTLSTPTSATTTFTGLTSGVYTVELKVTDDSTAVGRDTVQITVISASILDPADVVINYNSASPPAQPVWGTIGKWVRTPRLAWNTTSYKCYIYNGLQFRLKFPKTYNPAAADGKKYPMVVFFHGLGEGASTIYDNEYQLYHGGQQFKDTVESGVFDGYLLYPQSGGFWGQTEFAKVKDIIDYMVVNNKLDAFQVVTDGLSAGGSGTWEMFFNYPTYVAGALPISAIGAAYADPTFVNKAKFTPFWNFHGALDGSPSNYTAFMVRDSMLGRGANYKDTSYPTLGHGCWYEAWADPDFWPFIKRVYASNPWPLFGRTDFCPGDSFNVTIGITPGFDAYQWRKNGVVIPGATTNTIQATTLGSYDARVLRGSLWSEWSRTPVVLKYKSATVVSTGIKVSGQASRVIPAPDGSTSVQLEVPAGYTSYLWKKVGGSSTLSTTRFLNATTPGDYIVKVTEQYGCSSNFSSPFTVIDAAGPNKPDAAINLSVTPMSFTSLQLNWSNNPTPLNNETNFEIYQATKAGGPYQFVGMTGTDTLTYNVTGLNPGTLYYYVVRAVNNSGAAAVSNEAGTSTQTDTQAPTAPENLYISGTSRSTISLKWNPSRDNVGVVHYDIYVNGVRSYTTTQTNYTVFGLQFGQSYNFLVKAKDFANNISPSSNQVTGQPILTGLNYKFYTYTGSWQTLPDLSALTPDTTGVMPNIALTPRSQDDNFSFLWEGYIIIPVSGTYNFRLSSDDGSKLYLGSLNGSGSPYNFGGTALVNNDGLHDASTNVTSANQSLTAGIYPIAIAYYDETGSQSITLSWKTPQSGGAYVTVPNSAFADAPVVNGQVPSDPSDVVATPVSYKRIDLSWTDNGSTENGFEIWRSTDSLSGFVMVGTAPANTTNFADSNALNASTRYYYKLRAIGQYGESNLVSNINFTEANWDLNNTYADSSGRNRTLTPNATPVFDATNKMEGSHSIVLNGTTQSATISNSGSFLQENYTKRSVAFWMRSNSNTGNRTLIDIGGSDDGIAVMLNTNTLIAAVASNNVRANISTPYTSTGWNHIAVVYAGNTLKLYVNGVLAISNTNLAFTSITTTTNGAAIGQTNGTNALNVAGTFFSGWIDNVGIYSKALSVSDITNHLNNLPFGQSSATTLSSPALPAVPANLLASGSGTSKINITWNDVASENGYELYRSANNTSNYLRLAVLPANTISYVDSGLYANSVYYYKVRAFNQGGATAYSNEDSAKTNNILPVITDLTNRTARYGVTSVLPIIATDADGDNLSFAILNKPAFATLVDNGDKTASVVLNPAITDQGVYSTMRLIVNDTHGGSDTTQPFSLTVNSNYDPVISPVSDITMNEDDTLGLNLVATDQNAGDILSWTISNLPTLYTVTPIVNGTVRLFLHPTFASAGVYQVTINVTDGNGGVSVRQFKLTVNDKQPVTSVIYTRMQNQAVVGSPWNNITGLVTNNLKDTSNNITNVGLQFQNNWWSTFNSGPQTGNNSGVYPDAVLKEYYFFGSYPGIFTGPNSVSAKVTGLDTSKRYNLTFYAGSAWSQQVNNGTTTYTVGAQTVSINVQNNTQNTATVSMIKPASDGTITFTMGLGANTLVGYLGALTITSTFDDGTAPVTPGALTAQNIVGQGVQLNWQDIAYNENGYEVYRSLTSGSGYALLTTTAANATGYLDTSVNGATRYYYKVRAINSFGQSAYTPELTIMTANKIPVVAPIGNVFLKNNLTLNVNVTAKDDLTDNLTLSVSGLPSFAAFTDNGNGTGVISIVPPAGTIAKYPGITVTAVDNSGASGSTCFDLSVLDKDVSSVYVNFTDGVILGPKPWNNFVNPPFSGAAISNLLDDKDSVTSTTVTLVNGFQWYVASGMRPGNGRTVYPQDVIRTGVYEGSTTVRTIVVSGLSTTKKYNFVFFGSHEDGFKGITNFTINAQTVSLNATYNINKTVQINGVIPDATGKVTITVVKAAGQDYAYLSAMVIQGYASTQTLLSPTDLRIVDIKRNSVGLQWQDRSFDETGFEVYRSSTRNGTYSLVATLAANTTTYTNSGLAANTPYYYMVRAILNTTKSNFSNVVNATTYAYAVYINYANANQAASPWNNTNSNPQQDYLWSNLYDEAGVQTNLSMVVTKNFDGLYGAGMNTGTNTGVVPDNVMKDSYGLFPGNTAKLKFPGLNLSLKYDLTFFASSNLWGDVNTAYTVNGKTVMLDASVNTTGTVTMYDVQPDENGEINLLIAPGTPASQFGLIGGLIIQGHAVPQADSMIQTPAPQGKGYLITTLNQTSDTAASNTATIPNTELSEPAAYPSPFSDYFTLVIPVQSEREEIKASVFNATGQLVYSNQFRNLQKGNNYISITSNQQMMTSGIYLVKIEYTNMKKSKVLKLLKK